MTTQNLEKIINVSVEVSPSAAPRATFNEALIIGSSDVITPEERLRSYEDVADMLTDGFRIDSPEYLAAVKYFGQSPAPQKVWIGVRDIASSPEESVLEALLACREASPDWYMAFSVETVDADIEEIAPEVEVMVPSTIFVADSSSPDILVANPVVADIATTLKANGYKRVLLSYSNEEYFGAGVCGVACGLNSGLANSAFVVFCKNIVGATVEDITSNQRDILEGKNCNVYLNYSNYYNVYEQGVMPNGYFLDQIINRDMLVNDIQLSCMDLLYGNRKIPQTEAGSAMIYSVIASACELSVTRGYLGPGTYTGIPFLNLNTGDAMPKGYVIQYEAQSKQSVADREARKAVPFYVTVKEAGAVQSMTIEVIVNV